MKINKITSIRIDTNTKSELNCLDFVQKQTYQQIIRYLINFYKQHKEE